MRKNEKQEAGIEAELELYRFRSGLDYILKIQQWWLMTCRVWKINPAVLNLLTYRRKIVRGKKGIVWNPSGGKQVMNLR
jgi:hypothetical protein